MSRGYNIRTVRRHFTPKPQIIDGMRFDSTAEAKRYAELKLLLMAGEIRELRVKPKLPMIVNGKKIGRGWLELDFTYEEFMDGEWRTIYEDYKSVDTRESRLRRQVAEACNEIIIRVTT